MSSRTRVDGLAVIVFAVTSVGLAWLVATPLWLRGEGLTDPLLAPTAAVMMFTPAVATVLSLLVQRRHGRTPMRAILRRLGMWPLRPVGRTLGVTAAMLVVPPVLIALGLAVSGLFGLLSFDLVGFSGFRDVLAASVPEGTALPPLGLLVAVQLLSIPLAAVINAPLAFGEEVGWRGWLLPELLPLGTWPALLISGAFWGLWHAPLILLGYNFAEPNAFGVLLMIVACAVLGVLFGWTRLRTGSVWPAVFGHGALNAAAGMGALLVASGSAFPLVTAGPLGVVMWAVFAAAVVALVASGQFRRDRVSAELGPDRPRLADASAASDDATQTGRRS